MKTEFVTKLVRLTKAQDKWLRERKAKTGVDASTTLRLLIEREREKEAKRDS